MEKDLNNLSKDELIDYINDLRKQLNNEKYGIYFDRKAKPEDIVLECTKKMCVLNHETNKDIINNVDENLLIEGDNIITLSALNTIYPDGFVDVIYIDPPYNTGNKDFKYNDSFVDEEDGYHHTKWLNFMEARLTLAKSLLKDNGTIFISIDEREFAQLKLICDEIFGENNFISIYPRLTVKGGKTQTPISTKNLDFVVAYAKDIKNVAFNKILNVDDPAFKYEDKYVNIRGKYHTKQALDTVSLGYVQSLDYPIEHDGITYYPGGTPEKNGWRWTWSKEKYEFALKNDFIVFKNGRIWPKKYLYVSIEKGNNGYYIKNEEKSKNYSQIEFVDNKYSNTNGTNDLQALGLANAFDYAKPVNLIKDLLKMSSRKNGIIMDFFAGSGTTAQAVLELNKEDGGHRKFILCTNNENNIMTDVCYPRIKTVITGIRPDGSKYSDGLPGSVRYFKTGFVSDNEYKEQAKYDLVEQCDGLLCISESAFDKCGEGRFYNIYSNMDKTKGMAIFSDDYSEKYFKDMLEALKKSNFKENVIYYFKQDDERDPHIEEIVLKEIPDAIAKPIPSKIYEIYKHIADELRRIY